MWKWLNICQPHLEYQKWYWKAYQKINGQSNQKKYFIFQADNCLRIEKIQCLIRSKKIGIDISRDEERIGSIFGVFGKVILKDW